MLRERAQTDGAVVIAVEVFAGLDKTVACRRVAAAAERVAAAAAAAVERVLAGSAAVVVVGLAVVEAKIHSDLGLSGRVSRQHLAPAGPYAQCETR